MHRDHHSLSRRRFLQAAGASAAGVALAGGIGELIASAGGRPRHTGPASTPQWRSRPDLRLPALNVIRRDPSASSDPIFIAPYNAPNAQAGAVIVDSDGEAIWENPVAGKQTTNFRVQSYMGSPVLTWWEGNIELGHGVGEYVIADAAYREVRRVQAAGGRQADLHEFLLTPRGTALLTSYIVRDYDLRSIGGPRDGSIQDCVFQEIELPSGRLLMEWHSLDHVSLEESYAPVTADWDYFHINSIDLDDDGNLLVSSRSTHTVYKIASGGGDVLWRLGGTRTDFEMGAGTSFAWQHDARRQPDGGLTLFDNGASPEVEPLSRALALELDERAMTVALREQYTHPGLLSDSQGSVQILGNGNVFVGWGSEPYVSEFEPSGRLVYDAQLGSQYESYRAFRLPWVGRPADAPALALARRGARVVGYASWNGATEVAAWRLLGDGPPGDAATPVALAGAHGFETALAGRSGLSRFVAVALDSRGNELGRSAPVAASV